MSVDPSDLAQDVIRQIEEALREDDMTKADLASAMGVTPGYVSHLLVGRKSNLTLETLAKLGTALGRGVEISFSAGIPTHRTTLTGAVRPATAVRPHVPELEPEPVELVDVEVEPVD